MSFWNECFSPRHGALKWGQKYIFRLVIFACFPALHRWNDIEEFYVCFFKLKIMTWKLFMLSHVASSHHLVIHMPMCSLTHWQRRFGRFLVLSTYDQCRWKKYSDTCLLVNLPMHFSERRKYWLVAESRNPKIKHWVRNPPSTWGHLPISVALEFPFWWPCGTWPLEIKCRACPKWAAW